MDFIETLKILRNEKLEEVDSLENKKKIDTFRDYLINLFKANKQKIHTDFSNYIIAKPKESRPSINKEYSIPSEYTASLQLFFNQENGRHVKDFIKEITQEIYKGVHITIKNRLVISKEYMQPSTYKLMVHFEINFKEHDNVQTH
jgi:hypothetical protein